MIYIDEFPHEDWIKRVVPAPVKKHGSHDQSSHGNWAQGTASFSMADVYPRLQSAFPNATIMFEDYSRHTLDPEYAEGMVVGLEDMAFGYPGTAADVVMIRVGEQMNTTPYIAEARFTKTRKGSENVAGLAIVVNSQKLGDDEYESVKRNHDQVIAQSTVWPVLVGSTESKAKWAADIMTHEFGHLVHDRAMSVESGESYFNGVLRNEKLWSEALGNGSNPTGYPGTKIAEWSRTLDSSLAPSVYSGSSRAEKFAEMFVIRNGHDGIASDVDPRLDRVVAEMEVLAR